MGTAGPASADLASAGPDASGADGGIAFVAVTVGDLRLALPLAVVRAVIRLPELVRIPLGPPSLDGLAQWHGEAVPVLDLSRALGRQDGGRQDGGRQDGGGEQDAGQGMRETRVVLVGHRGQPVGLRVDAMAGILRTAPGRIDPVTEEEDGGLDPAMLDGVLRDGPATILRLDTLIDRQFGDRTEDTDATAPRAVAGRVDVRTATAGREVERDAPALLVFGVAGQEFALPVDRVREVLPAPREVARMARAKAHLLGVMAVRDRLLPLVGLRALFGLESTGNTAGNAAGNAPGEAAGRRVVVVRAGDGRAPVGVLVDEVREILRLDRALIDPVPPLLAREPEFEDLDGIARVDGGRRLVSVLSAERLFRHGAALGSETDGEGGGMEPARTGDGAATERFVVFRLAGAEYGLPVAAVREVLRRPDHVTPLPNAPDFVAGVLTLRGEVLPLIDQRRLLHLPALDARSGVGAGAGAEAARGRVVVVGREGADATRVGLLVDGLSGLLTVSADRIGPAPAVSAAQRRLIRRVATPEEAGGAVRLILLMDAEGLLDMDRLADLQVPDLPVPVLPASPR